MPLLTPFIRGFSACKNPFALENLRNCIYLLSLLRQFNELLALIIDALVDLAAPSRPEQGRIVLSVRRPQAVVAGMAAVDGD